jgi:hypothetical protein
MSETELRLECLRIAGGAVDQARKLYEFATGKDQKADVRQQGLGIQGAAPCPSCGQYRGLGSLSRYGQLSDNIQYGAMQGSKIGGDR